MGKDIFSNAIGKLRRPHELKILFKDPFSLILLIDPREDHGLEAEFGKDLCIGARVPEWIQLPADLGLDAKLFHQKGMT